jgi:hypothetical protein
LDPNTKDCDARFDIRAWVATEGYWQNAESSGNNNGAVLLVQPASDSVHAPVPLVTTSVFGLNMQQPRGIATSGFPLRCFGFPRERREWNATAAPVSDSICPLAKDGNANADCLAYIGSSCSGHNGDPLVQREDGSQDKAFGIFLKGTDCQDDGTSRAAFTLIVDQAQAFGVWVEGLIQAAAGALEGEHHFHRGWCHYPVSCTLWAYFSCTSREAALIILLCQRWMLMQIVDFAAAPEHPTVRGGELLMACNSC